MRTCIHCKEEKEDSLFKRKEAVCAPCVRLRWNSWYASNKEKWIGKVKPIRQSYVERNQRIILEHLSQNPCIDCGESDIVVLEFDHLRDKKYNVSRMSSHSEKVLREEISKCVVRCANCHKRKTAKEQGWYKS